MTREVTRSSEREGRRARRLSRPAFRRGFTLPASPGIFRAMRLAVLGFLAALVALPLAAEAAQTSDALGGHAERPSGGDVQLREREPHCGMHRAAFRQDDARVACREHTAHRRQRRALELTRALPARTALPRAHHEVRREGLVDGDASVPGRGDPHRFGHVQREDAARDEPGPRLDGAGANRIAFRRRSVSVATATCAVSTGRQLSGFVAERGAGTGGRGGAACGQPPTVCRPC